MDRVTKKISSSSNPNGFPRRRDVGPMVAPSARGRVSTGGRNPSRPKPSAPHDAGAQTLRVMRRRVAHP